MPLAHYITCTDPGMGAVLKDWLESVYVVADAAEGFKQSSGLTAGAMLVCPQGHVFTCHSASFHAADSEIHGILSRQREIEVLEQAREGLERNIADARSRVVEAQAEFEHARAELQKLR